MVINKSVFYPLIGLICLSLACRLGGLASFRNGFNSDQSPLPAAAETIPVVEQEFTETLPPTPEESAPTEEPVDVDLGQIAFISDGHVWHQYLNTGEIQQVYFNTENIHVRNMHFSHSGRYLAFQAGWDDELQLIVFDLETGQELTQLAGKHLIGWRHGEDSLWMGQNSTACPPMPTGEEPDEANLFIISAFDPLSNTTSDILTIDEAIRIRPLGMSTERNLLFLREVECFEMEHYLVTRLYSEHGEHLENLRGLFFVFSPTGDFFIPIIHCIHAPQEDSLLIRVFENREMLEIYSQPGKYVTDAFWSPSESWIAFWIDDVVNRYNHTLFVIRPDGTAVQEVLPTPEHVLGWYDDGHLLLISAEMNQIDLYHPETGEMQPMIMLDQTLDFREITWQR